MLSAADNELLTRVGPGTPCGDILRRYWQPACYASDLAGEQRIRRVKIMGEELVVFRSGDGAYGCLAEHCAHRGVSLYYGFVEECGIRCPYHGWKYDNKGACVDTPFEPNPAFKRSVTQKSYPVQELGGILFIYMGPQPAPLLPRWDVLVWEDGHRSLGSGTHWSQEILDCNWLQAQENTADIVHTYFLHGHVLYSRGVRGLHVDYFHRPYLRYGFQEFEWGMLKSWEYASGGSPLGAEKAGGSPLVFPNMLRVLEHPWHAIHWRVPIDDTHTRIIWAGFLPSRNGEPQEPSYFTAPQRLPGGEYTMDTFPAQDKMAWETQGEIADRTAEHLGASDRGITIFRRMLREQIARVRRGEDPIALVRDAERNQIIELPVWVVLEGDQEAVAAQGGGVSTTSVVDGIFGERHETFDVPPGAARPNS